MPKRKAGSQIERAENGHAIAVGSPERIAVATELLFQLPKSGDVAAALVERFQISRRWAQRLIEIAREEIAESAAAERSVRRAKKTIKLDAIADKAEDAGEFAAAVAAHTASAKLNGDYAPEQVEHTHTISDEEYATGLAELRQAAIEEAETSTLVAELERRGATVTLADEAELVQ